MAEYSRIARRIRVPLGFVFAVLYFWLAQPTWRFHCSGRDCDCPGTLDSRAGLGPRSQERSAGDCPGRIAYTRNPLYLGLAADGHRLCSRGPELVGRRRAGRDVLCDLSAGDSRRRSVPAREVSGVRGVCAASAADVAAYGARRRTRRGGGFSMELYRKHREYNALLGALAMFTGTDCEDDAPSRVVAVDHQSGNTREQLRRSVHASRYRYSPSSEFGVAASPATRLSRATASVDRIERTHLSRSTTVCQSRKLAEFLVPKASSIAITERRQFRLSPFLATLSISCPTITSSPATPSHGSTPAASNFPRHNSSAASRSTRSHRSACPPIPPRARRRRVR